MPLNLAQLHRGVARITVSYAGESFWVDYRPHAYTMAIHREFAAAMAAGTDDMARTEALVSLLPRLIDGWDVTDDGAYLPVDEATLATFPLPMLVAVAYAVVEHVADPNRAPTTAAPTPSSSGPPHGDRSESRPTGTTPSPAPGSTAAIPPNGYAFQTPATPTAGPSGR